MTTDNAAHLIPRWDERERLEREQANVDADQIGDVVSTMEADFFLPRLAALDHERAAIVPALKRQLKEHMRQAEGDLSAHELQQQQVEIDYQSISQEFTRKQQEVSLLERRPSENPGDGYPSSLAIEGGGVGKTVRKHGAVLGILAVLLCVEIPIYYETFLNFGDSRTLTFLLAVGAILVFVFGPHFYGRKFREWQENGQVKRGNRTWMLRPSGVTIPPVLWLIAISSVAYLRLDALTSDFPISSSTGGELTVQSVSDEVGFVPALSIILSLMIFTALIALELGRRLGNPVDNRLKELRASRNRARADLDRVNRQRQDAARLRTQLDGRIEDLDTYKIAQYETELKEGFDRLEITYTEAFMLAISRRFPHAMKESEALTYALGIIHRHRTQSH